jgi:hypothetical protein
MLGLSWPLWVGASDIPRVPFVPGIPVGPAAVTYAMFLVLVVSTVLVATADRWWGWYALSLGLFLLLVAQDQHRFQPWVYQYAMTCLLLAALPRGEGLRFVRWWFVSLYLHSGLSKLDVSFRDELGPVFLNAGLSRLGLNIANWPPFWRHAGVFAMPLGEILVAICLMVPAWRRVGRLGAVAMHLVLIAILGPFGLGHSTIVLIWNAAMMIEVCLAFGPRTGLPETPGSSEGAPSRAAWRTVPVKLLFWAGVLLPLGERWGYFDAWPSHALYASHIGRVTVWLHESELSGYPASLRRHVAREEDTGLWHRLDLTGWSRAVRGTPVYPQDRAGLGLAEGLAARYRAAGHGLVRVVLSGPADRWTGARTSAEAVGLDAIRALGDRYRVNAHAAGDRMSR